MDETDWEKAWEDVGRLLDRAQPTPDAELLRHLHSSYVDRFLSDNQRIWATAAILVPASLAAFPVYFAADGRSAGLAVVFGAFSVAVMTFWYFIAERHRYFQKQAHNMADYLEDYMLTGGIAKEMRAAARVGVASPRVKVRTARRGLLVGVAVLWALIAVLTATGQLS